MTPYALAKSFSYYSSNNFNEISIRFSRQEALYKASLVCIILKLNKLRKISSLFKLCMLDGCIIKFSLDLYDLGGKKNGKRKNFNNHLLALTFIVWIKINKQRCLCAIYGINVTWVIFDWIHSSVFFFLKHDLINYFYIILWRFIGTLFVFDVSQKELLTSTYPSQLCSKSVYPIVATIVRIKSENFVLMSHQWYVMYLTVGKISNFYKNLFLKQIIHFKKRHKLALKVNYQAQ